MEKPLHHQWQFRHVPLIIRHQLVSPSYLIMHLQSSLTDSQDPPSPPQVIVIHIVHKVTLFQELVRLPIISAGCCSTMILESCCGCSPSLFIREHIFKPKSGWGSTTWPAPGPSWLSACTLESTRKLRVAGLSGLISHSSTTSMILGSFVK